LVDGFPGGQDRQWGDESCQQHQQDVDPVQPEVEVDRDAVNGEPGDIDLELRLWIGGMIEGEHPDRDGKNGQGGYQRDPAVGAPAFLFVKQDH
jgi:hypothetical protein